MSQQDGGYASIDGQALTLVLPGLYDVSYQSYSTFMMFGRAPKLHVQFRIMTMGEHFEKSISRFCNVRKLIGRPGPYGRFKLGFCCDFVREFARLFGMPLRLDRIPMSHFEKHIFVAKVRTVEKGSSQRPIPEGLRYSVITELVRIKD